MTMVMFRTAEVPHCCLGLSSDFAKRTLPMSPHLRSRNMQTFTRTRENSLVVIGGRAGRRDPSTLH